jgi:uncharacterized protein involved in exopolysaccharide biosynthesis
VIAVTPERIAEIRRNLAERHAEWPVITIRDLLAEIERLQQVEATLREKVADLDGQVAELHERLEEPCDW